MREERVGGFVLAVPTSRRERARGLLGRSSLGPHEGLLLRGCRSVHTFGMRIPIDVVLLDAGERAVHIRRMAPRRLLVPRRGVRHMVEVAAGRGPALKRALDARTTPDDRDSARRRRT